MCVIIVKNKGVEMPSKKELKLAFEHNPHGWGIVSSNGIYAHGMTFEDRKSTRLNSSHHQVSRMPSSA